MAKKSVKSKAGSSKKSTSGTQSKKDVKAFVDHLEKSREIRARLRKAWDDVVSLGKKKGFKFTRQELRQHFKERYGVNTLIKEDEPDTCICV